MGQILSIHCIIQTSQQGGKTGGIPSVLYMRPHGGQKLHQDHLLSVLEFSDFMSMLFLLSFLDTPCPNQEVRGMQVKIQPPGVFTRHLVSPGVVWGTQ